MINFLNKPTPGPPGTIWSDGIHHVFYRGKPARVKVPQYTIPTAFKVFQDEIQANGGITLGYDHIPKEVLEEYPILKELNPHDVGQITEIGTDGERIYATKSEHTNPLIAELHSQGKLPAFSVVAPADLSPCETEDADYVFNNFKSIDRMDYVKKGGCLPCKVGAVPDVMLTAKLSMEVDNLTDQENNEQNENTNDETNTTTQTNQNEGTGEGGENTQNEGTQTEGEGTQDKPEYVTKEVFDTAIGEIKDLLKTTSDDTKMEARLADLEQENKEAKLEAQKAVIGSKIDTKIKEGTVIPAQREGLLQAGLSMKDEDFDKHLATYKEKIVDMEQHSHLEAGNSGTNNYSKDDFAKDYEAAYGEKPSK